MQSLIRTYTDIIEIKRQPRKAKRIILHCTNPNVKVNLKRECLKIMKGYSKP